MFVGFLYVALFNVNPGLVNPWLINRGVSPFSGGLSLLEGTPPYCWDRFINPGSTLPSRLASSTSFPSQSRGVPLPRKSANSLQQGSLNISLSYWWLSTFRFCPKIRYFPFGCFLFNILFLAHERLGYPMKGGGAVFTKAKRTLDPMTSLSDRVDVRGGE